MNEAVQWLLKAIPTYVLTFGQVFVAPKTEIVAKCRGEESAVPDALVFLGVSQLVLYPLVQGSTGPHSAFWDTALRAVSVGIIGGLATLAVLALAWRIIGARLKFSELIVAYCYMLGVFSVISSVLSLAVIRMFAEFYPKTYRAWIDFLAQAKSLTFSEAFSPSPEAVESIRKLQEMPGYFLFLMIVVIAFWMALLWLFFAWGTFRQLASVSRLRSFIALAIFLLLWLPVQMIQGFAIMQSSTQDHSGSSPPSVRVEEWGYCPKAS